MCDVCQLACPTHFSVCLRVCSTQMNSEGVKTASQRSLISVCCSLSSAEDPLHLNHREDAHDPGVLTLSVESVTSVHLSSLKGHF